MKRYKTLYRMLPVWVLLLLTGLSSCDYIHDDIDPCKHYFRFAYTYNMKFADAFTHEMINQEKAKNVRLYIFDKEGSYLQTKLFEGETLQTNRYELDLEPGTYRLLAWGGLNETDYTWEEPAAGSSIEDFQMSVKRSAQKSVNRELLGLFQGEMTLEIPEETSEHVMYLVKNTNKIRFIFIDPNTGTENWTKESFEVKVVTKNGDLAYDNTPVTDTAITWLPYYSALENVKGTDGTSVYTTLCTELNTLRLVDTQAGDYLQIRYAEEEEAFLSVDLTDFLSLTQMESHDLSRQEYLDRQDEYTVLVYVDVMGGKAHCLEVIVNDWVIRLNDIDLGKEEL